ncbi:MAG: IS1634 family transposase, partial [Thermodesulfobium sp.]
MIRKDSLMRGGVLKTHVRVVEGYRPGPGMPTKQRTIKSFGYLEDQEDPEAFMSMVKEFNANFKNDVSLRIEVASNALMYSKENRRLNYGYKFL